MLSVALYNMNLVGINLRCTNEYTKYELEHKQYTRKKYFFR